MARRRRSTYRRRKTGAWRQLPRWAVLFAGLVLGVALVLISQLIDTRMKSKDGIVALFTPSQKKAVQSTAPPSQTGGNAKKPTYDFYTILPEIETVLPERVTDTESTAKTLTEKNIRYILQAASFASFEEADRLKAKLALNGLISQIQKITIEGRGEFHRVRLGPFEGIEDLNMTDEKLRRLGIKALRLKVKTRG
jgi:cell division protein FtsN